MSHHIDFVTCCVWAQQVDGQAVVCWHCNPNDVVADMMEDDSMVNQFEG